MVAPGVVVERVTDCAEVYVPGAGRNVGVAACDWIVYVALATALGARPVAVAIALIVCVALTVRGVVYLYVDPPAEVAGAVPSKV
jgi:hypothetical protein